MSPGQPQQDDLYQLIGQVAAAGALGEFALRLLMVALLDSQYAEVVAAGRGVSQLVDDCRVLVNVNTGLNQQQKGKVTAHLDTLKELMRIRNDLIHGLLSVDGTGPPGIGAITAIYSKLRRPYYTQTITVEDAQQAALSLDRTAKEILIWTFTTLPDQAQRQQSLPLQ